MTSALVSRRRMALRTEVYGFYLNDFPLLRSVSDVRGSVTLFSYNNNAYSAGIAQII